MNIEGKRGTGKPVLQFNDPRILPFMIRSSLFDIHHSMGNDRNAKYLMRNKI